LPSSSNSPPLEGNGNSRNISSSPTPMQEDSSSTSANLTNDNSLNNPLIHKADLNSTAYVAPNYSLAESKTREFDLWFGFPLSEVLRMRDEMRKEDKQDVAARRLKDFLPDRWRKNADGSWNYKVFRRLDHGK
jgi:hypothetical protein